MGRKSMEWSFVVCKITYKINSLCYHASNPSIKLSLVKPDTDQFAIVLHIRKRQSKAVNNGFQVFHS
jgi:hypothetical protein